MKDHEGRHARLSAAKRALLEQRLRGGSSSARRAIPFAPRDAPLPLSFAQERFWFLAQLEDGGSVYNVPLSLELRGALDVAALEWSLSEVVRRHESLRTTFAVDDGQLVQVIADPRELELPLIDLSGSVHAESEARRRLDAEVQRPFDLTRGPLCRFVLFRLASDRHVLLVTMHHVTTDELSQRILWRELAELYEARTRGRASPLPDLPVQYADYACWQRRHQESGDHLAYWKTQLGALPVLDLPTDRPRPAVQTFRGKIHSFEVPQPLVEAVKALGKAQGCTAFMAMLAAFKVLLARYAAQEDVVVGTPIANRNTPEVEPLIGLFLNTLVLRTDLSGDPGFRELLARVRDVALEAYRHQDVPFEQLVLELQPERDQSRNPLFQVLFQFREQVPAAPGLGVLDVGSFGREHDTAKFDLSLGLGDAPDGGAIGVFEYNVDLFSPATIARMQRHFMQLLAELARDPDRCIWDVPMLTSSERRRITVEWNATRSPCPSGVLLHESFEAQAVRTPGDPALIAGNETLSYAALNRRANQVAHHLRRRGVGSEDLVGVCLGRGPELVVAILAVLKAGAAYVPLDPEYPAPRLSWMLADAATRVVVTQTRFTGHLPESGLEVIRLDADAPAIERERDDNPTSRGTSGDNAAYVHLHVRLDRHAQGRGHRPRERGRAAALGTRRIRCRGSGWCPRVDLDLLRPVGVRAVRAPLVRRGPRSWPRMALALPGLAVARQGSAREQRAVGDRGAARAAGDCPRPCAP